MYIPKEFEMNDSAEITNFIRTHSFGVLFSNTEGRPVATHLPFFYDSDRNVLFAHMAKANPQWRDLDGQTGLVVFSGPHAYISPSWYGEPASVPTWNYVAVHVYGKCSVLHGQDGLDTLLKNTVQFYEPHSDLPARSNEPFYQSMMKSIVGFRIDITSIEGKAKLSQNKSLAVQERVVAQLHETGNSDAVLVSQWMQRILRTPDR
ncbi:FMN-binding negative transcriptional regulator [Alicyclobacillaceae bacterium I2511]|nr:FMN-binding negative transcriptional regulator [Alicyclobacillaceae bacterium I2511]